MSKLVEQVGSEQRERLEKSLKAALAAVGATDADSELFGALVARYAEPQRHYHTLAHVDTCLTWLDWFAGSAEHRAEVELALWFHDGVYDPSRSDNEAASAALARVRLRAAGACERSVERIDAHILATRCHSADTNDAALVIDVDLAILAATRAHYARFEQQIRREYLHVPEPLYREARTAVLQGFLSRPRIYHTTAVREALECRARRNLELAIAALQA